MSIRPITIEDITQRMRVVVALHLCRDDAENIPLTARLDPSLPGTPESDDLDMDSLDKVELCMAMEDEFGLIFTDEERDKINTVGEAVSVVAERLGLRAPEGTT